MLTFELGSNIELLHSKSYFDIPTGAGYHTLTFGILFWNSNWDRISDFDIRNPFLTFKLGNYGCSPYMYLQEHRRSDKN